MIKSIFFTVSILFVGTSYAQLVVDPTPTPNQLVQNVLLGGGVTASGVTYVGAAEARASFTATGTNLGLAAGVILSTGIAENAAGTGADFASDINSTASDADLEALSGQTIADVAILEFDFIPTGDTLRFRYVFGSEEYPEYVCDIFNDAFGFFLSGPGIAGPFSNGAKNIALIPGTTVPITINSVNSGVPAPGNDPLDCAASDPNWVSNSIYYVDNELGTTISYDGFTTVMTAFSLVECGQQYHIKLAIGDGGDSSYDSAVFLEAGSFTSAGQVSATLTGGSGANGTDMIEGCGPWDFVFTRIGELDVDATVDLTISGTSTAGVDYSPAFPAQVYFPVNVDQVTYEIDAPMDADGMETLIIDVEQLLQCANIVIQTTFTFNITSLPVLDVTLNDINSVCNQQNILAPVVTGGEGSGYTYLWNTGEVTPTITVTPGVTTTYDVTVSGACGVDPVTEDVVVTLPVYDPLDITVSPATQIVCLEDGQISVTSATGGNGVFAYEWTLGGAVVGNTATITVEGGAPVWYYVTVSEGCGTSVLDSVFVSAVVLDPILVTLSPDVTVLCAGDTVLLEVLDVTGGGGVYSLAWTNQSGAMLSTNDQIVVGVPMDQTYTVSATDQCQAFGTATVTTQIPNYAPLQLTMPADINLCAGDSVTLAPSISGASGYYYVTWANMDFTDPVLSVMPNENTVYTVTVTDQCGEQLTDQVDVNVEHVQMDIVAVNHGQDDWHVEAATIPYGSTWVWDMGDGTRYRNYEAFHSYMDLEEHWVTLRMITPNGCVATDSILLRPPSHIYFSNAFTPDGDGVNDMWGPKGHYIESFEMTIFDRWGSQVFTTKEMDILWDGSINGGGKAPTGVYVYKYRAEGHLFPSTEGYGHVTLLGGSQK